MSRRGKKAGNILLTVFIILLAAGLVFLLLYGRAQEREQKQELEELQTQIATERSESRAAQQKQEEEILKEQEKLQQEKKRASDSFYQKLSDGFNVNILVVGDSIGAGAGAETANLNWVSRLQIELMSQYKVNVGVTNVSMGGENTSYAEYARIMSLNDGIKYDLAILCCGAADPAEGFSQTYESIIRGIMNRYPACSILAILENSQELYGEKMQAIRTLANYYGIPTVDMTTPFNSNVTALTVDGVHPNNEGQRVYFEELLKVIVPSVEAYRGYDLKTVPPLNAGVAALTSCQYIASSEFQRDGELSYLISLGANGCMGIDYDPHLGADKAVAIYVDDALFTKLEHDYGQRTIVKVADTCQVTSLLQITFQTKEVADGFFGVYFSSAA